MSPRIPLLRYRVRMLHRAYLLLTCAVWFGMQAPAICAGVPDAANQDDVSELVEKVRAEHNVPGLVAAMVRGDELVAIGASGVRKVRNDTPVTIDDQFHIGSCTKSMTATVAAMLIEDGLLTWETTVAEALPDLADVIHEQYRDVTLRMLLSHRSGLPEDRAPPMDIWPRIRALSGPMHQQRIEAAKLALNQEPAAGPGEAMHYSNFGYVIAGAMMEEVTGKTWEELLRMRLFEPLGTSSAGFGPPGAGDEIDPDAPALPWGHMGEIDTLATMRPGPLADNPALLGPAGTVHCNLADWAKYASFHLSKGEGTELLPAAAFDELHTTQFDGGYALGWGVTTRPWAGGTALSHSGSNGMWYAVIWLAPNRNTAYLAACNVAGDAGPRATDQAVSALIRQFNARSDSNGRPEEQ